MALQSQLDELCGLAAHASHWRTETGIPRVAMVQGNVPPAALAAVYEPMVNLILRGSKTMTVGERVFNYDPASYFVMSVDLPAVGAVHPSATGEPYLAVSLTIEPQRVAALLDDLPPSALKNRPEGGFSVASVTAELLDAWVRMLRLMTTPDDIAALAPGYEREILYHVLKGPHGWMLRDIASPGTMLARIGNAIRWLRHNFAEEFIVASLAEREAMSVSAFHRHFKAVTAMSPLQYQKRVRLLHARTMLLGRQQSVTFVAQEVGYKSVPQFNRDYARIFGLPPLKDVAQLRKVIHVRENH
ncbi:AraC family transcriptional regulator N-terminal domain-containing protein [Sodalis sp. C49]|uniref:AraC family transcriptional regulator n=1 Tax=unclassified Sodalis (in: enterobacteria) TaxID=2636512 RepID=UPI003965AC89